MIIALDRERNRRHIDDAPTSLSYYCPCCGETLLQRRGEQRRHHFAHYPGAVCTDTWSGHYDMSDWHFLWQDLFPKENQEIILDFGEVRHRADVMIGRTVVEFQHSTIGVKSFQERNSFYLNLGHKVIWVFDLSKRFVEKQLTCDAEERVFQWKRPAMAFRDFRPMAGRLELFFYLRDAEKCIVKVAEVPARGFETFTVSGWFSKAQFLEYLGVRDGRAPLPEHEGALRNEAYQAFCERYNIRLNPQQERAVQAVNGANLLLAVPGSGKTTVLVARLGYMILCRKILPEQIVAMTFSRQAARDMRSRFAGIFGEELAGRIRFCTIHSFANAIVKDYADRYHRRKWKQLDDNKPLVVDVLRRFRKDYLSDGEIAEAVAAITHIKNLAIPTEEITKQNYATPHMDQVFEAYQVELQSRRLMDYDDQVAFALRILKAKPEVLRDYQERYPYICVDEAQDTSKAQHDLLRLLAGDGGNMFLVGDEDQSIYRFRGAYPQALLEFRDRYPNPYVFWMEVNFRSTPQIVDAAASFIEKNQQRYPKNMAAHRSSGTEIQRIDLPSRGAQYEVLLKIAGENPQNTAVLYRDNDSALPLIARFLRIGVSYRCPKREFVLFSSRILRDVEHFAVFLRDERNFGAFRHICGKLELYLNRNAIERIRDVMEHEKISAVQAMKRLEWQMPGIGEKARALEQFCSETGQLKAKEFLRYLDSHAYGAYLRKERMDRNVLELLTELAEDGQSLPEFLAYLGKIQAQIKKSPEADGGEGIILSTVHSAKGLEYDRVYIMDLFDGRFPGAPLDEISGRKADMDANEEERRLFYVAMTRARDQLILLTVAGKASSFAEEICPMPKSRHRGSPVQKTALIMSPAERVVRETVERRKKEDEVRATRMEEAKRQYLLGFEEVQGRSFREERIVVDSFGRQWGKCEFCGKIAERNGFAYINVYRNTPSLCRCSRCMR